MSNPFAQFKTDVKSLKVEALGGQEVKVRQLTIDEVDMFANMMIGEEKDGKVTFNYKEMANIRKQKVALALVEPKMTVEEINALSADAIEAINEIADFIDEATSNKGKKKS